MVAVNHLTNWAVSDPILLRPGVIELGLAEVLVLGLICHAHAALFADPA